MNVSKNPWAKFVADDSARQDKKLAADRAKLIAFWREHPWHWLAGVDPTTETGEGLGPGFEHLRFPKGRPLLWTTDERDNKQPIKPFPREKEYLYRYIETLQTERLLAIDKCRQMYISTATLLYMDWLCRFFIGRCCVLSKRTEEEAIKMLTEKTRRVHERLPAWLREALPMKATPRNVVKYSKSQSDTYAANEKMAEGMARGGTATFVFVDEATYQAHAGDIVAASLPMANQLVLCGTANLSNAGARAMKVIVDEQELVSQTGPGQ